MNLSRSKTLIGLLYAVILSLPLLNIAGRVLYTQWNKNAKDSYSGQTIIQDLKQVNTINDVLANQVYFSLDQINRPTRTLYNISFLQLKNSINSDTYLFNSNDYNYNYYAMSLPNASRTNIYAQDVLKTSESSPNMELVAEISWNTDSNKKVVTNLVLKEVYYNANEEVYFLNFMKQLYYNAVYYNDTLDNAFEYSINKITDNNLGEVQFFTWFADLFLDLDNASNMLYVGFVNWYFNYALLVSLGYLMFMVLMWFIGLARKILEKGQNFGEGGY